MPTDVIMPQMGESIVEGTITKWLKKPGDKVQRDEPLFEISTDKVDAEIPAPASGVLQEIKVTEGTTVGVNTVVGTIAIDGESAATKPAAAPAKPAPSESSAGVPPAVAGASRPRTPAQETQPQASPAKDDEEETRSSPLVRKIAREHNVSLSQITGTGLGGRITKQDIMQFIESQESRVGTAASAVPRTLSEAKGSAAAPPALEPGRPPRPAAPASYPGDLVPMSNMRKLIAKHMIESRRTSAHVHCMYEVDFTRIVNLRNKLKSGFEQRHGARLTFMPFFVRAAVMALQQWPIINANIEGDNIHYHRHINMGIAVALDWGLIVPVLKNAGDLNFLGLQRGITDLGERARNKKLKPEDVEGSTFTITNPGQFGAVFGLPIINQPNSAIMGVGGITKQPMVITDKDGADSIAIRSVVHLTLGYDHRLIDGAVADQFMAQVKKNLETWSEEVG
ncbi:MAG TPA: 2-oxoglutarate dehydrogenase, E2 component, dihydrolipoamide succinyltransferase [Candidatus Sulfotelmatobacter sp.]|jgi:2-oxoglutarate dehydrogenase E2 component (dihydrolipoamide succinyltransferase)|nr:2-oxoglutarate dehydrogenase, E2 component, dihydrolipoamide succinyltransferase [Candidatus Sulfotelmatobacter sp.]